MDYADELVQTVVARQGQLHAIDAIHAAWRPTPGAWAAKEIIGHLIDSAANNHQRFVRAQWQDDLVFPGYEQDAWVTTQGYQDSDWHLLVDLWSLYNQHLAQVMRRIPAAVRFRQHTRHNLHLTAWTTVPESEPTTLDYFMRDYVGHLQHHLRQLDALAWPRP